MFYKLILGLALIISSCSEKQELFINAEEVKEIEVDNGIGYSGLPKFKVFDDQGSIFKIINQVNEMKKIDAVPVNSNNGDLKLIIRMHKKPEMTFDIIYSTYHGVIILGVDGGGYYTKYYKNDYLEMLLLKLMHPEN